MIIKQRSKSINLKDKTSIADFMIIASGNSSRHIQALSEILLIRLKKKELIIAVLKEKIVMIGSL